MISFPNAKINLGLNIVERRPDGYHDLETVFYPIGLTDVLEIVPAKGGESTLTTYGNPVDCPAEKNLVMKALRLMQQHYDVPEVDIYLYKHIPDGAGLGGGSSDASSTMLMLNEMFDLGVEKAELARLAATLGADCPFFIYNQPMMATGIGEILTPINVSLKGMYLFLVKPAVSVPTKVAYSRVTPAPSISPLEADLAMNVNLWNGVVKNDFEPSVFAEFPELAEIKSTIEKGGALYASMSGSGSSIFGIFDDVNMAEKMRGKFDNYSTYVIELL
ncbi:MAG: 4-(cytidine 5'-diphospho)-2-C-methyl-D-erythritol kinase [Muribaculaceae bacterium]|nr:4-(cytidine 5'-diphospho)-2-C-methyl-D-erythritol kinase [Muribaculaceae bacterium]